MPHLRAGPARPAQGRARSGARGQCPGGVTRRASDALTPAAPGHAHGARARSPSAVAVGPWSRPRGAPRVLSAVAPLPPPAPRLGAPWRIHGAARGQSRGQSRARRRSAAPRSAVAPPLPQPSRIAARVPASLAHGHGHGPRSRRRSGSSTARAPSARGAPPPRRGTPKGRARSATGPLAQLRARTRRRGRLAACPASRAHAPTASVGPSVAPRGGVSSAARRPPVGARRASRGERRGELKNVSSRFLKRRLPFAARTNRGQRHASHGVPRGPRRRGSRSLGARGGVPLPRARGAGPVCIAPFLRMLKTGHKVHTLAPYSQLVPLFCRGRGAHAACQASERRRCPLGTQ